MTRKKKLPQPEENQAVAKYEPTEKEQKIRLGFRAAIAAKPPVPMVSLHNGKMEIDHPDTGTGWAILANALGTSDVIFAISILNQLGNAVSVGKEDDPAAVNFALSVIAGVKPKDELETMLAAQMAVVHTAVMTFSRRLAHVENIAQQDSAERTLNKLARTFTTQMEALKRYRTGGEQKVTVHHVTCLLYTSDAADE